MPTLSSLYDKFIRRATLTTEEKTDIRDDIAALKNDVTSLLELLGGEAADPARIGAEYLPEAIEVTSLVLSNSAGIMLDSGGLALNADGRMVLHDGLSNGEDLAPVLNSSDCLNFSQKLTASQMDPATYYVKAARIILPATASDNGKRLNIIGRIESVWTAGSKPDSVELVIVQEDQDETSEGYILPLAQGVTSEMRDFDLPVTFESGGGEWAFAPTHSIPTAFVRKNNAGTITHAMGWDFQGEWTINTATDVPPYGPTGVPLVLDLYVRTADAAGTVTADLYISGSLNVIHE